jgi:hypothetical protein
MNSFFKCAILLVFVGAFSYSFGQEQSKYDSSNLNDRVEILSKKDQMNILLGTFQIQMNQNSGRQLITDDLLLVVNSERSLTVDKMIEFNTGVVIYLPSQQKIEADNFEALELYKYNTLNSESNQHNLNN